MIWSRSKSTSRTRSVQHSITRSPVPYSVSTISRWTDVSRTAPITRRTSSTLSTVGTRARRPDRSPSIGPKWSAPNSSASTSRYRNTMAFIACVCVDRAARRPVARWVRNAETSAPRNSHGSRHRPSTRQNARNSRTHLE